MKLQIDDEVGTALIAVLKLDGTPAVEGIDFALWEGDYKKAGKWSYTPGGVVLSEGIVIFNQRSTHSAGNNQKRAYIVRENTHHGVTDVMGRWEDTSQPPQPPVITGGWATPNKGQPVFGPAWPAVLSAVLTWGRQTAPEAVRAMEARW